MIEPQSPGPLSNTLTINSVWYADIHNQWFLNGYYLSSIIIATFEYKFHTLRITTIKRQIYIKVAIQQYIFLMNQWLTPSFNIT